MTIFEILNDISFDKKDLSNKEGFDKEYNPWMVNRYLSMDASTVFFADLINSKYNIPKQLQYKMLLQLVQKRKRFFKFEKGDKQDDTVVKAVSKYYNVSYNVALQYSELLNETEKTQIKDLVKEIQ